MEKLSSLFRKREGNIVILSPLLVFTQYIEHGQHEPNQNDISLMLLEIICLTTFAMDFSHEESIRDNYFNHGLGNLKFSIKPSGRRVQMNFVLSHILQQSVQSQNTR